MDIQTKLFVEKSDGTHRVKLRVIVDGVDCGSVLLMSQSSNVVKEFIQGKFPLSSMKNRIRE